MRMTWHGMTCRECMSCSCPCAHRRPCTCPCCTYPYPRSGTSPSHHPTQAVGGESRDTTCTCREDAARDAVMEEEEETAPVKQHKAASKKQKPAQTQQKQAQTQQHKTTASPRQKQSPNQQQQTQTRASPASGKGAKKQKRKA